MCLNAFAHSKGLLPHWLSSPAPFHPSHKVFLFLLKVEKSSSLFSFIRLDDAGTSRKLFIHD